MRSIDRKRDARASCVLFILKERKAFAAAEPRKTHEKQFLEAGRIVGTHGVRGEMRVEPWCDSADFLKKVKTLYFDGGKTDAGSYLPAYTKAFCWCA